MQSPDQNDTTHALPLAGIAHRAGSPPTGSGPPSAIPPAVPAVGRHGERTGRSRLPVVLSGFAVVLAAFALLLGWRALDQAGDAKDIALAGAGTAQPTGGGAQPAEPAGTAAAGFGQNQPQEPPPTTPAAGPEVTSAPGGSSTSEPKLDGTTAYKVKYEKQPITLKASCGNYMYTDLDEPRADVHPGADLYYNGACSERAGTLVLTDGVTGSGVGAAGMTAHDCWEKIRTTPLGGEAVPVRKGVVICLRTSFKEAQDRGDAQRIVLIEVTGVSADNAVDLRLTAWNIPG